MKKITRHLVIPATVTVIFFINAFLPVEVLGCLIRGLIAAFIAIAAGVMGNVAAVRAVIGRVRGDEKSVLWVASALVFAIPAIYIVLFET